MIVKTISHYRIVAQLGGGGMGVRDLKDTRKGAINETSQRKGGNSLMATAKAQPAFERDPVKLDSKHYKAELENDRVRVVRVRYAGREKSVMHQHPPGVAVFLTDGNFKFSYPDGKTENIKGKAGEYLWFGEVWEHLPENLSGKNAELIYVELKS